jgi:Zinc finger, ZZ type
MADHKLNCNHCHAAIVGVRYKCANCNHYDLCQICESRDVHRIGHILLKIKMPLPDYGYHIPLPDMYAPNYTQLNYPGYCCVTCQVDCLEAFDSAKCRRCSINITHNGKFCNSCSHRIQSCRHCGHSIKFGNFYVEKLINRILNLDQRIIEGSRKRRYDDGEVDKLRRTRRTLLQWKQACDGLSPEESLDISRV